jgi:hemerythrin-like metal-binding protein
MEAHKWKAAYDISLDPIDRQHRALVDLLNQTTAQAARDSSGGLAPTLVDRLERSVADHFLEEEWMAAAWYEGLARHRAQH